MEHQETILHRDRILPVIRLDKLFTGQEMGPKEQETDRLNLVVLEHGANQFGVKVDKLISQQDIVIKQLTKDLKGVKGFAGATILGDGSVALVLDVGTLV